MASTPLRAGLRHRLIQQLAAKQRRSHSAISQGFTLIELLVVVIIVGILAAVALPGFLSQSDKAKASSAKAMVSAAVKEFQVYQVDATTTCAFEQQIDSTGEITLDPPGGAGTCDLPKKWTATILSNESTYSAEILDTGIVEQTCVLGANDTATSACQADGTW